MKEGRKSLSVHTYTKQARYCGVTVLIICKGRGGVTVCIHVKVLKSRSKSYVVVMAVCANDSSF